MLNLLIVDDEHHIVNYMSSLAESNFENSLEVYRAYSGTEALRILSDLKIDIILLDIQMPGMTGLELAGKISRTWRGCRIIFLTAYDSFDYIYTANEIPNTSYLLKTEPEPVILNALSQAIEDIQKEQEQKNILDNTLQRNRYLSHLLMQHSLRNLQSGMPMDALLSENVFLELNSSLDMEKKVYLIYMHIRHRSLRNWHSLTFGECLQYLHLAEYHTSGKFNYSLLQLDNADGLWFFQCRENADFGVSTPVSFLRNIADALASDFEKAARRKILLLLYPEPVDCCDVHRIFYRLQRALEETDFSALFSAVVMCPQDTAKEHSLSNGSDSSNTEALLRETRYCLLHGNEQEYMSNLKQLQEACQSRHSMHHLSCVRIYQAVALDLLNTIDSNQLQEELSTLTAIYPLYYINNFTDWEQAFQYLHTCAGHVFRLIAARGVSRNNTTIERIQKYIQSHIEDQLNLAGIAATVNYNESYVSRLFRQHTGMKISDYILQVRLSKAKQLLSSSDQSINAIAESCGFDSIHYFSYTFKKNMGMTPSDYRRSMKQ